MKQGCGFLCLIMWQFALKMCIRDSRDNAARKVGTISHVGIGTFADPRNGGGRLSEKTKEDIVKIIELEGQEQLFYPRIPLDVARCV